ncbi:MAG: M23 family metallopeptidase, partial [Casimicrobiaceae bacterium]
MRRGSFPQIAWLVLGFGTACAAEAPAPRWPLDLAPVLTSSFGEYRPGRFHAGIDLATGGRTGAACHAVGDGSVVRMRMSPYGYGKALYVQLDNGPLVVYAHLSRFAAPMAARARAEQRRGQRYTFDVNLPPGEMRVQRNTVIAWSGDTGIGVPHFHFELRDGDVARNPQTAGFPVHDTMAPAISEVSVVPL